MEKISRKGFLKVAAAAAMSGVTAGALAACNSASSSSTAASASGDAIYTPGTYTGTGKDNREIALGTRPKAVLVCTEYGVMWTSGGVYGGLALDGTPTKARTDTGTVYSLVTITDTGFKLRQPGNSYIQGNASNTVYHYIAFC